MTKPKIQRTPEQKAAFLREHHLGKKPVSDICEAAQLQPSLFYYWQKQLFDGAPLAFDKDRRSSREKELEAEIAALKAKLADREATIARKDGVIAEISGEYVAVKKARGEL